MSNQTIAAIVFCYLNLLIYLLMRNFERRLDRIEKQLQRLLNRDL